MPQDETAAVAAYRRTLVNALHGMAAHVDPAGVFDGLDWQLTGRVPPGLEQSVWQQLGHLTYWQDFCLDRLTGVDRQSPEHAADSWPEETEPENSAAWDEAVARFLDGVNQAQQATETNLVVPLLRRPETSRGDWIGTIASHNSYHLAQIVLMRRLLGAWPPPSGGDTW